MTKELMIGDWVQTKFECPFKVLVLGCGTISDNFEEDVIPIPLTEEILKENGLNPLRFCDLSRPKWRMNLWNGDSHIEMTFKYVHELQRALRLCGLNELADNFKIKKL